MSGSTIASGSHYSPGPTLADMSVIASGGGHSWAVHLCAHPGTSPDTATPMRAALNFIDDVRNAGDSVGLPPATGGQLLYVVNRTDNACSVFTAPNTSDTIYSQDATTTFAVVTLAGRTGALFLSVPGQWSVTSASPESGGGDVVGEAPQDGFAYVRSMAAWLNADARYVQPQQVVPATGGNFTGAVGFAAPGISFPSLGGASANYQLAWSASRIWPYVNGTAQGSLAYTADLPQPSSTAPPMDGTAGPGTGTTWARADHIHPTDTSRYAASNPAAYINITQARTGVTDGSDATAGQIGEYLGAQCLSTAPVTLTTGVDAVVISLSLSAGDWDVWGSVAFASTTAVNDMLTAWINPAGTTMPSLDQMGGLATTQLNEKILSSPLLLPITPLRVSQATSSTVRLGATAVYQGGTMTAFGKIMARRRR